MAEETDLPLSTPAHAMDRESAIPPGNYLWSSSPDGAAPQFTTPSTRAFKLDEGYSDEAKSPSYKEVNSSINDAMTLPDWVLAQSEQDRAGMSCLLTRDSRWSWLTLLLFL